MRINAVSSFAKTKHSITSKCGLIQIQADMHGWGSIGVLPFVTRLFLIHFDQTFGQEHVKGESYKSLIQIGGSGSPGTSGVKNVIQCSVTTKLGQKNRWNKLMMMMMTFIEVKGHQRSNVVLCASCMATKIGQKNPGGKLMMIMTFMEV